MKTSPEKVDTGVSRKKDIFMERSQFAISAVIFDLDGTLLDTLEDIASAFNAVLKNRGLPVHPTDAYRHFVGDGPRVLTERALPADRRDPETIESCLAGYLDTYRNNSQVDARPYSGIPELLDELSRRNIPMAVVSNKVHEAAVGSVSTLLSGWRFSPVFGFREGIPRKPDPFMALAAAEKLDLSPERIAFVGDTAVDMQTARAASMTPVGVLWGFRTEEELRDNGARVLLARPEQLLGYLS